MKKQLTWEELLVLGGFNFKKMEESVFSFSDENNENLEFLKATLNEADGLEYCWKLEELSFVCKPISLEAWMKLLSINGGLRTEMLCSPDRLHLKYVDISMLAIIRQLNRIGLLTRCSCSGHGRINPRIQFSQESYARKAKELLISLGFQAHLLNHARVDICVKENQLYEVGYYLWKINKITPKEIKQCGREMQLEILDELLNIPGSSGHEGKIRKYLMDELVGLTDKVTVDEYGNILAIKKYGIGSTVLLSAHMDVVSADIDPNKTIIKDEIKWFRYNGILGADDRAGIAIIINLLKTLKRDNFKGTLKIALTVEEEIGQYGAENIDPIFFWDVDCAISLDRRNGSDIVAKSTYQNYCGKEYACIFENVSVEMGHGDKSFEVVTGGISDLRVWSSMGIESVNLSVGFYNEHTKQEYLNLEQWHRTFELVKNSLKYVDHFQKRNGRNQFQKACM